MNIKLGITSVALASAMIGSIWLTAHIKITTKQRVKNNNPEAIVTHVRVTNTDTAGRLTSYFTSPKITKYQETSFIEQPRITIYGTSNQLKNIRANYGKNENDQRIQLWGNVVITQTGDKQHSPLTITTQQMFFYPKQKIAKTKQFVTIMQPGKTVSANGLTTNLMTGVTELLSHVHAIYNPQQAKKQTA